MTRYAFMTCNSYLNHVFNEMSTKDQACSEYFFNKFLYEWIHHYVIYHCEKLQVVLSSGIEASLEKWLRYHDHTL